uniref:Bacteriophage-related protein n=1 Tax=Ralstonia solanacearum TaxID=305 RepID=A0A0S4U131_RALSL
MIASICKRGHEPPDENEADALAILYWAAETQEA